MRSQDLRHSWLDCNRPSDPTKGRRALSAHMSTPENHSRGRRGRYATREPRDTSEVEVRLGMVLRLAYSQGQAEWGPHAQAPGLDV